MANFSDGPDSTNHVARVLNESDSPSSAGKLRQHLAALLEAKENQLQQAGALGQRVLQQRVELESRIHQLQELATDRDEDEEVNAELRLGYRQVVNMLKSWEDENVQMSSAFLSTVLFLSFLHQITTQIFFFQGYS